MRKGQAAMEFLMTYGWAILVVLVVIGALAYFGVLSPGKLLPRKCDLPSGLVCVDHRVVNNALGDSITLRVNNAMGADISITSITFTGDLAGETCNIVTAATTWTAGEEKAVTGSGAGCTITTPAGSRIRGKLTVTYQNLQTTLSHTVSGLLVTDVEAS